VPVCGAANSDYVRTRLGREIGTRVRDMADKASAKTAKKKINDKKNRQIKNYFNDFQGTLKGYGLGALIFLIVFGAAGFLSGGPGKGFIGGVVAYILGAGVAMLVVGKVLGGKVQSIEKELTQCQAGFSGEKELLTTISNGCIKLIPVLKGQLKAVMDQTEAAALDIGGRFQDIALKAGRQAEKGFLEGPATILPAWQVWSIMRRSLHLRRYQRWMMYR